MCQDKPTCEGWHHEGERRRNPGVGPNFLYSEEPCLKLKAPGTSKWLKPTNCKDGDACRFSHTLMEQMYHPNIYKTSLCTNFTANGGDQCQWGYFCTHAHGQKDIRNLNKKDLIKRQTINNKQKQQKTPNNISQMPNVRPLETFKQVVSVLPKLFQKISPLDTSNHDNENLNYLDQQVSVSQHSSDNGSPSRSYHTPLYQPSMAPLNVMNTPSTKHSALTPSGSLIQPPAKPPQLLLPTPASYYQSHNVTPNTATYERTFYNGFQTFPNHLGNEKQQQYSWDVNSSDTSNLQPSFSSYTPANNSGRSPPLTSTTPFEMCNTNNDINNINSTTNVANGNNNIITLSPNHGAQVHISSTTNLSSRPIQLTRPRSVNIPVSNPKLHVTISPTPGNLNQSMRQLTPPYTSRHIPRFPTPTSTYQPHTPQLPTITLQPTITPCNDSDINTSIWVAASQNGVNDPFNTKTLQLIEDIASPVQPLSPQQILDIPQSNLINSKNVNGSLTKETSNNLSYYFLGDDSLLSPASNKPDGLTKTPPPPVQPIDIMLRKGNEESIVIQLKAEINELKKELESEKEKNKTHQDTKKHENDNNPGIEKISDQMNACEKYNACPSCHCQKPMMDKNVFASCEHIVCKECAQKGEHCPICE